MIKGPKNTGTETSRQLVKKAVSSQLRHHGCSEVQDRGCEAKNALQRTKAARYKRSNDRPKKCRILIVGKIAVAAKPGDLN